MSGDRREDVIDDDAVYELLLLAGCERCTFCLHRGVDPGTCGCRNLRSCVRKVKPMLVKDEDDKE